MDRALISTFIFLFLISNLACKKRIFDSSTIKLDAENDTPETTSLHLQEAVEKYLLLHSEVEKEALKADVLNYCQSLLTLDKLKPGLLNFLARATGKNEGDLDLLFQKLFGIVSTELANRARFESWNELDKRLLIAEKKLEKKSLSELIGRLSSSKPRFLNASSGIKILVDGPESWKERKRLISSARKIIWIFSWSFYEDLTGEEAAGELIRAKDKGIDVRVIVDGNVAMNSPHKSTIDALENKGIAVQKWVREDYPGFGMHRKMFIVDPQDDKNNGLIMGGMNYGDSYSHQNPKTSARDKWRDTDLLLTGKVVSDSAEIFKKAWNLFAKKLKPSGEKIEQTFLIDEEFANSNFNDNSKTLIGLIDHEPSSETNEKDDGDKILLAIIAMIDRAKSEILISNAYFITPPPILAAVRRALKRDGMSVKIHTNSHHSLAAEDQILLGPIYKSLYDIAGQNEGLKENLKIYLQDPRTLHSKYMVIDKSFGLIGSYNIHPRSSRYESEVVAAFLDQPGTGLAQSFSNLFERDIAISQILLDYDSLQKRIDLLTHFMVFFFFEQL